MADAEDCDYMLLRTSVFTRTLRFWMCFTFVLGMLFGSALMVVVYTARELWGA
jgi:hypothetical protein